MICLEDSCSGGLTQKDVQRIHAATLEVLEKTGVVVAHAKAREILSGAGCRVDGDGRVRFPPQVVERAIEQAPEEVTIYSRLGEPRLRLGGRRVHYGTVTSLPFTADLDGNRRAYTLEDCRETTILMDALNTMEFATATGNSADVPPAVSDTHEQSCIFQHSPKPVLITTHDVEGLRTIMDICAVYKGDMAAFKKEPFVLYCVCPISPLKYAESALSKMMLAVESGFPFIAVAAPGAGGTSPISVAGTLVVGNAEMLCGLVLTQAIRPGAPFLYGGFMTNMDLAHMIMTHGSPEFNLLNSAQARMARHYGVPSFSSAGCTDAHEIDEQAGFEIGFNTLVTALSGANLVHAMSVLGSGTAVCKELLILSDEYIRFTERFCRGVATDDRRLAVEDISRVGPGGSFMDSELTLSLFREEVWYPKLFVRDYFEKWVKEGKPRIRERLKQEAARILREHTPVPVDADKLKAIDAILRSSDRQRLKNV